MKAIILGIIIGLITFLFPSLGKAQTQTDSTKYVITLTNGNEYIGYIISDDGREVQIQSDVMGKIFIPKSEVAKMEKKVEVENKLKSKYKSVITLADGSEIIGHILSDNGKEVVVETDNLGKVYLSKKDIKTIVNKVSEKEIINGEYMAEGPFTTRYCFSNNALPIRKGENYAIVHLYGPEVHFAVSERLNIGIMSTWIGSPLALAIKYTFKTKESKLNFSLGNITGTSGYIRNFGGFGSLNWASMTLGDRKNNFTISGGYGFIRGAGFQYDYVTGKSIRDKLSHGPAFSVAGIFKVGAKASFILEGICFTYKKDVSINNSYYDNSSQTYVNRSSTVKDQVTALLIMPGMRFQTTDKKAFQVSIAGVSAFHSYTNNDYYSSRNRSFPIPMLSWFYKF